MPSLLHSLLLRLALRNPCPWRQEDELPLVEDDQVRDHLNNLETHKSISPDGMHTSAEGAGRCHC